MIQVEQSSLGPDMLKENEALFCANVRNGDAAGCCHIRMLSSKNRILRK